MLPTRPVVTLAAALLVAGFIGDAAALARTGGVVSMHAGAGACRNDQYIPLDTFQDSFAMHGDTACGGGAVSADLRSDAATGRAGLKAQAAPAAGSALGHSQVAAQVAFSDQWLISVPAGTPVGSFMLPVSLRLQGEVMPGAVASTQYGRFLDYSLSVGDYWSFGAPGSLLAANGQITAVGAVDQTFAGLINVRYFGPGSLATTLQVSINLFMPGLQQGELDFFHTASVSLALPPGFSATTSSGLPLVFAPVPEPATGALLAMGLAGLAGLTGCLRRRRMA